MEERTDNEKPEGELFGFFFLGGGKHRGADFWLKNWIRIGQEKATETTLSSLT